MKKYAYPIFVLAMAAVAACQDSEMDTAPLYFPEVGDEISFGSSLNGPVKRTLYGDAPENGAYPVYWEDDGSDQVTIYCPQANGVKLANYSVTPNPQNPSLSAAVTKVEPNALQWGEEGLHQFYGFYPASAVLGTWDGKIQGYIPVNQNPVAWDSNITADNGGTDGRATYTGVANTDYAFMWAYGEHNRMEGCTGDVALTFHPWVTILDIVIPGPDSENAKEVEVTRVGVRSTNGTTLNGQFVCDMTNLDAGGAPTYEGVVNESSTRSNVTIETYNEDTGGYISLGYGDTLKVRAYLLPADDDYGTTQGLQVRVGIAGGRTLTRTLRDGEIVAAHKVNAIKLGNISSVGNQYWMSDLDPDIYVNEVSMPGSKFSYQASANGVDAPYYQNKNISGQFYDGVRAFLLQTGCSNNQLYVSSNGRRTSTSVSTVIADIASGLQAAEIAGASHECAFVLLAYEGNASTAYGRLSQGQSWMSAIQNVLQTMSNDPTKYRLYTGEITANTTLDDVKGKIIVKVNYNNEDMANYLGTTARVPALFSQWTTGYVTEGVPLRWGTSNHNSTSSMTWFYHEATHVGNSTEETWQAKQDHTTGMWDLAVQYYAERDTHDMWYMNDIGGTFFNYTYGGTAYGTDPTTASAQALHNALAPIAVDYIQGRSADRRATLGIVYMNFADATDTHSSTLIQSIINNNFNFQLRKKASSTSAVNRQGLTTRNGANLEGWD